MEITVDSTGLSINFLNITLILMFVEKNQELRVRS